MLLFVLTKSLSSLSSWQVTISLVHSHTLSILASIRHHSQKTWKTARVSPIPKVDNPLSEKDYRPVSILPSLSKIFERLVFNQILVFIEKPALLASSISGYRRGHSTTTVLMGIRDDIIRATKKGEVTLMVCSDYSKAFHTAQFKAVLAKLHEMGFSKSFLLWVLSYLSERRQLVQIDEKLSELAYVDSPRIHFRPGAVQLVCSRSSKET